MGWTNTINPVAILKSKGREVVVSGPAQCDQGESFEMRVTVTQESTGAMAAGECEGACTGRVQKWEVTAIVQGDALFEEGPAEASALHCNQRDGKASSAHQWCKDIVVVYHF